METNQPSYFSNNREEFYTHAVRQVFMIEAVTLGTQSPDKKGMIGFNPANGAPSEYIARYSGHLITDSAGAYDHLAETLAPGQIIPLFRMEEKQQVVYLVSAQSFPKKGKSNPWINLALFILTLVSVWITGGSYGLENLPQDPLQIFSVLFKNGWPFVLSMLGILGVHEFGHYFAGRLHNLDVTLPYFIPFPLSPMGTMGAFINMRGVPKNRNHLMDVGVAGPLSGFLVTLVVLWVGLSQSGLAPLPSLASSATPALNLEGNSILYLLMKFLTFGKFLPQPVDYQGIAPFLYWIRYFFTGQPLPFGGLDVSLNSVAWAGWCGLLVTGLNLLPAGQLDGGHIGYIILGRKWMRRLYPILLILMGLLGIFWSGWWLWVILIFIFGRFYAEPLDQITPLSPMRKFLGIFALLVFIITFIPIPLNSLL